MNKNENDLLNKALEERPDPIVQLILEKLDPNYAKEKKRQEAKARSARKSENSIVQLVMEKLKSKGVDMTPWED